MKTNVKLPYMLVAAVVLLPLTAKAQEAAAPATTSAVTPVVQAAAPATAETKTPAKPADEFPKMKISGKVYGDLTHRTGGEAQVHTFRPQQFAILLDQGIAWFGQDFDKIFAA